MPKKAKAIANVTDIKKSSKFEVPIGINNFTPTEQQQPIVDSILNNKITFIKAPAGTGKTSTVLHTFCKYFYLSDLRKKMFVIRTPQEVGDDKIGFLPGDTEDKLSPYFEGVKEELGLLIGAGKTEADIDKRIFFRPPNYLLGRTLSDSLIFVDEAQTLSPTTLELIMTRFGHHSKMVIAGDIRQVYRRKLDALSDAIYRFVGEDGTPLYEDIGYVEMDRSAVMRDEIVMSVIEAYSR